MFGSWDWFLGPDLDTPVLPIRKLLQVNLVNSKLGLQEGLPFLVRQKFQRTNSALDSFSPCKRCFFLGSRFKMCFFSKKQFASTSGFLFFGAISHPSQCVRTCRCLAALPRDLLPCYRAYLDPDQPTFAPKHVWVWHQGKSSKNWTKKLFLVKSGFLKRYTKYDITQNITVYLYIYLYIHIQSYEWSCCYRQCAMTAAIMYQYCHKTISMLNTERWLFEQFTIWFEAFWTSTVTVQSFHIETFKVWQRTSTVSTTALRGILARWFWRRFWQICHTGWQAIF